MAGGVEHRHPERDRAGADTLLSWYTLACGRDRLVSACLLRSGVWADPPAIRSLSPRPRCLCQLRCRLGRTWERFVVPPTARRQGRVLPDLGRRHALLKSCTASTTLARAAGAAMPIQTIRECGTPSSRPSEPREKAASSSQVTARAFSRFSTCTAARRRWSEHREPGHEHVCERRGSTLYCTCVSSRGSRFQQLERQVVYVRFRRRVFTLPDSPWRMREFRAFSTARRHATTKRASARCTTGAKSFILPYPFGAARFVALCAPVDSSSVSHRRRARDFLSRDLSPGAGLVATTTVASDRLTFCAKFSRLRLLATRR